MEKKDVPNVKELQARIEALEGIKEGIIESRNRVLAELTLAKESLTQAHTVNIRLQMRLEACLYSLVLMQHEVRSQVDKSTSANFKFDEVTREWETVRG